MKNLIAKTDYYSIEIDKEKNRAYLGVYGFCKKVDDIPNFLNDIRKASDQLSEGFTLLTDVTGMKTHPPEVSDLHVESQKVWLEGGLLKTAELMPPSAVDRFAHERRAKSSGMLFKGFESAKEAEAWLDENE